MTSYNQMDSDFDNAKWEIQSTFGDIDNDDVATEVEVLWQLARKSDDAQRILMPIVESINKLNKAIEGSKQHLEALSGVDFEDLHIEDVDDDEGN